MSDKIDPRAYSEPCGCGAAAGQPCPHTPIRCPHRWWYGKSPSSLHETVPPDQRIGGTRECEYCHRIERAKLSWETVKA